MAISEANRKFCAACGKDVTFAKRLKGPSGGLFCVDCGEKHLPDTTDSKPAALIKPGRAEWFYLHDNHKRGPVDANTMKRLASEGRLKPEDRIWRNGMPDWVPASQAKSLFPNKDRAANSSAPMAPMPSSHGQTLPANAKRPLGINDAAHSSTIAASDNGLRTCKKCGGAFSPKHMDSSGICNECGDSSKNKHNLRGSRQYAWLIPTVTGVLLIGGSLIFFLTRSGAVKLIPVAMPAPFKLMTAVSQIPPAPTLSATSATHGPDVPVVASPQPKPVPIPIPVILFRQTPAYAELRDAAAKRSESLATDLIGEDSAYRGISKCDTAARDLLAIFIKVESHGDPQVASEIDSMEATANIQIASEDSAIRAAAENDEAFFDLVGVWCKFLNAKFPGLQDAFDDERNSVTTLTASDDSAPRACSAYSHSSVNLLSKIVTRMGYGDAAKTIATGIDEEDIAADSAYQEATASSKGVLQLLLVLLKSRDDAAGRRIDDWATEQAIADDSTLQERQTYLQATVDALEALVAEPK